MKRQTKLIISILGLSAFASLPAAAQSNQVENFFGGTPPYDGDRITQPLNQLEQDQDSGYNDTQESEPVAPTTTDERSDRTQDRESEAVAPTTTDERSDRRLTYPNQTEYRKYVEQSQRPTRNNLLEQNVNPNRNLAY